MIWSEPIGKFPSADAIYSGFGALEPYSYLSGPASGPVSIPKSEVNGILIGIPLIGNQGPLIGYGM